MRIERTKNATRNILWGVIEKISSLLLPFVTRTLLIKYLGEEYLGLSSLFTSILSVLSISELGFGTAIVFSMYKPIAEDDNDTVCALLNTYRKVYEIVGLIILAIGLLISPILPKLIKGEIPGSLNIYALYYIYLFNTVISYFLFAYKGSLFSAHQRNDLISKRKLLVSLLGNILKIISLVLFRNYYAYVIIIPLETMATNLITAYLAQKLYPNISCKGSISNIISREIRKRIIGLLSFKIYNVTFTSVDSIVISSFLGLVPLAMYNNYYYIQSTIIGFLSILTSSITAGVGNKMVTNSIEDNYSDFKKFTFTNGWLCSWCAICLLCLYQPFIRVWVGEKLLLDNSTMVLMVLYFLLPRITTMTYTYREAAGLWWEDRFRPLVSTAVNLTINIVLVHFIGINGVILSTLACTVFINVPWGSYILFKNYFKRSPIEYFRQILLYISATVIAGALTLCLCNLIPVSGFGTLVLRGIVCTIISNIILWFLYHRMEEYNFAKNWFSKILMSRFTNRR